MENKELKRYNATKQKLDEISPSFCLAKWLQVTLHLQNGRTHSCHHPSTHHIPIEEIEISPDALHNTKFKHGVQKQMIEGGRPDECQYCWNVEDLPGDHMSDRVMKSADSGWAGADRIDDVVESHNAGKSINPSYVEVSFSNVCNFKCSYCSPVHSSRWVNEIETHGAYDLGNREYNGLEWFKESQSMPIHHKEHNPYVEAFWEWWPDLVKDLKVFRITGGEPLLDKNTFKVMDFLNESPNPEMEFSINSNLCVPNDKIDSYIEKMKLLINSNKIRRHVMYTSVDGHGKQAEYGRNGLDYVTWIYNVDKILTELPTVKMTIMCTTNIFSITSMDKLLKDVYNLKIKHRNKDRDVPLTIDMSILRWPAHQCAAILPEKYADLLLPALEFMEQHSELREKDEPWEGFFAPSELFFAYEVEKLKRFIEFLRQPPNKNEGVSVNKSMEEFYLFVNEHDRRRGTNFLETFPELEEFYRDCEVLANNSIPALNI